MNQLKLRKRRPSGGPRDACGPVCAFCDRRAVLVLKGRGRRAEALPRCLRHLFDAGASDLPTRLLGAVERRRKAGGVPGDELADLFPGTGIVGRAWREIGRRARSAL